MADNRRGVHPAWELVFESRNFIRQELEDLIDRYGLADGFCGYVFLCRALRMDILWLAKFFIMEGASVICENSREKVSPMILAVQCSRQQNVPPSVENLDPLDDLYQDEGAQIELTEIVELLLDRGASVNDVNKSGRSALHYAALFGRESILVLLLRGGAEVNKADNQQVTPLHLAASMNHSGAVELLLMKGADPNATDSMGETPLHIAASKGHSETARMLLAKGADSNITTLAGETPLHFVGIHADSDSTGEATEEIVTLLLKHKANMYAQTHCGRTPLHINIRKEGIVKILLEHGVDVNTTTKDGRTPLHFAAEFGNEEVVRLLLNGNADAHATDADGRTPLHFAAEKGCLSTVKSLLEKGAKVDVVDSNDNTPVHLAAKYSIQEKSQGQVIEFLSENGADVNALNKQGDSPINRALWRCSIYALSKCKAKINWQGNLGQTALHHAVSCNKAEAVKALLHSGADSSLEDSQGKTPLALALSRRVGYHSISMILKKHTVRLKVAKLYVNKGDLSLLSQNFCDVLKRFEKSCEDEVLLMKKKNLDKQLTLFNVLSENRTPSYVLDKNIKEKLADFDFDPFPIYRSLIMNRLNEECNDNID